MTAVIISIGVYLINNSSQQASSRQTKAPAKPQEIPVEKMTADEKMMSKEDAQSSSDLWAGKGAYLDYSPELVAEQQKAGRTVVLFFHAAWCPTCKTANTAFLNNIDQIPQGVSVIKTDYDNSSDLKKKYGITYQHTFVQIDSEGNMISKWSGGDIDALKKNLK